MIGLLFEKNAAAATERRPSKILFCRIRRIAIHNLLFPCKDIWKAQFVRHLFDFLSKTARGGSYSSVSRTLFQKSVNHNLIECVKDLIRTVGRHGDSIRRRIQLKELVFCLLKIPSFPKQYGGYLLKAIILSEVRSIGNYTTRISVISKNL